MISIDVRFLLRGHYQIRYTNNTITSNIITFANRIIRGWYELFWNACIYLC